MLALIDMDLVCFRSAASAEEESSKIAISRMNELLDTILEKSEATSYKAFLTGPNNFRKKIYPEYKANRTAPRPKHLEALQHYALKELEAEWAPDTLEADDALAINQDKEGLTTVICSLDKDMLQVPGKHFQWAIGTAKWSKPDNFVTQTELEGLRLFYEQCLKGDRSDNIKGVQGIGEVKAKKLLADAVSEFEMFDIVRSLYSDDSNFVLNAQCLWLLRSLTDSYLDRFNTYSKKDIADGNKDKYS